MLVMIMAVFMALVEKPLSRLIAGKLLCPNDTFSLMSFHLGPMLLLLLLCYLNIYQHVEYLNA